MVWWSEMCKMNGVLNHIQVTKFLKPLGKSCCNAILLLTMIKLTYYNPNNSIFDTEKINLFISKSLTF